MKPDDPDKHLASALGRVPSGIYILTARHDSIETGMLASWVQQCSFKPPRVSIALQPGRPVLDLIEKSGRLTLNILESSQTDALAHFGRGFATTDDAFRAVDVLRDGPGGPILEEALAALECRFVQRISVGDHDLFIAEVTAGRLLDEGQPMVHIRKNGFHY